MKRSRHEGHRLHLRRGLAAAVAIALATLGSSGCVLDTGDGETQSVSSSEPSASELESDGLGSPESPARCSSCIDQDGGAA
ncbi:MAG: hypothetical protein JRI23_16445 [Deltaproteobacteria bacterium]|jgi:hypothetical protein|nr:hypothetical protein [Deltaproteobacteria bacterium]MBW2533366.1 hypothetical protein [Deltaproteobacteria bacterium]